MSPEEVKIMSEKWVYIGEIEMKEDIHYKGEVGRDICPDGNTNKHFLLKRNYHEGCMYSILSTRKKKNAEFCNPVYLECDHSILAILTFIVSNVAYTMFRNTPCEGAYEERAIRLVGMTNWIKTNKKYRKAQISNNELEKLFESDRIDLDEQYELKLKKL